MFDRTLVDAGLRTGSHPQSPPFESLSQYPKKLFYVSYLDGHYWGEIALSNKFAI